jgi:hypothetical protein
VPLLLIDLPSPGGPLDGSHRFNILDGLRGVNGVFDVALLHLEALRVSLNLFLSSMVFCHMWRWGKGSS